MGDRRTGSVFTEHRNVGQQTSRSEVSHPVFSSSKILKSSTAGLPILPTCFLIASFICLPQTCRFPFWPPSNKEPIRVRNRPSKEQRALYPVLDTIGKRRGVTAINIKQFGVFFAWLNFFKKNFFCFLLHGVARFPGTQWK